MLGYGGTDKPADACLYIFRLMAQDMVEIIDHESLPTVIPIGHDLYIASPLSYLKTQRVLI